MHHFFVKPEQIEGRLVRITGPDVNHGRQVLRLKEGENLLISDGAGRDYVCAVKALEKDCITAGILREDEEKRELPAAITLYQGLPKQDKMELIIQKAVELGVARIVPVATEYAVVKLDGRREEAKLKRWQAIAENGARQSKRSRIPQVGEVRTFKDALLEGGKAGLCLFAYEHEEGMAGTKRELAKVRAGQEIALFVGPEGGFSQAEVKMAREAGFAPISLGKRILRTETAGLALLSVLMLKLEMCSEGCTDGGEDGSIFR